MARQEMLEECPNCGSTWGPGSEEWMFQQCDACGYPDPSCKNFMREEDDYDDYDEGVDDFTEEPDYDLDIKKRSHDNK